MAKGLFQGTLVAATLSAGLFSAPAVGQDPGCFGDSPVVDSQWPDLGLDSSPVSVGSWTLPRSSREPQALTHATANVDLVQDQPGKPWKVHAVLQYTPGTGQWAIPYTFQKLEFRWQISSQPQVVQVDWSNLCKSVGRSIVPGNPIQVSVDLPGTEDLSGLEEPQFLLWGSQN